METISESESAATANSFPMETPPPADVLGIIAGRRSLVITLTGFGALLSLGIVALLPVQYRATAVIMAPQQQPSAAMAMLGQFSSMVGSTGGRDLGLKNPSDLYVGLLRSRTISDALIARFGLRALYGANTIVDTRKALASRTEIEAGKDTLIRISVDDTDPRQAAAIANAYIAELSQKNDRLAVTESAQRRAFFEKQLAAERDLLTKAEAEMKATQERTGLVQVDSQVEVAIRAIAALRAEITACEVQLQRLRVGATSENPEVVRQEKVLAALRQQLHDIEQNRARKSDPMIAPSQAAAPGLEYLRRLRDVKYHESLFEMLAKQYESARIDEAKEAPLVQVVDAAVPPDQKNWPPCLLLTVCGTFAVFLLSCAFVIAAHHWSATAISTQRSA